MPGTPTTKYAIPTFNATGTDPVNAGHTQINSALSTIDSNMAGYATGTFAGKPAAGKAGRVYVCTDTGQWLADTGSAWVDLNAAPAFVSSLPGSPYDGQEIYFQADLTNGVVWHLRYRAASASAYKWEMVGGGALTAENANNNVVAAGGGWVDVGGPSLTIPLAGDYEFVLAVTFLNAAGASGFAALKFGATAEAFADGVKFETPGSGVNSSVMREMRRNVSAAGQVVKINFQAQTAQTQVQLRNIRARPIRVG